MFCFITSRKNAPSGRVFSASVCDGFLDFIRIIAEIRQPQGLLQPASVGVRVGTHSPRAGWG